MDAQDYIREAAERDARTHDAPLEVLLVQDSEAIGGNLSRGLPAGPVGLAHMRELISALQWPATRERWAAVVKSLESAPAA